MAGLTDSALVALTSVEDATRLTMQLLPDVPAEHHASFFRSAEQHLLAYALIDAVLRDARSVNHLPVFLALDSQAMTERFKAAQPTELLDHARYLAVLSDPRLSHARWGVRNALTLGTGA